MNFHIFYLIYLTDFDVNLTYNTFIIPVLSFIIFIQFNSFEGPQCLTFIVWEKVIQTTPPYYRAASRTLTLWLMF
jgi:hypothetical protein